MCGVDGKIFFIHQHVATWQRPFHRRRYHSSSHAWRRKSRTILFLFWDLKIHLGKCLSYISGWLWGILFVCSCFFCKQRGRFNGYEWLFVGSLKLGNHSPKWCETCLVGECRTYWNVVNHQKWLLQMNGKWMLVWNMQEQKVCDRCRVCFRAQFEVFY